MALNNSIIYRAGLKPYKKSIRQQTNGFFVLNKLGGFALTATPILHLISYLLIDFSLTALNSDPFFQPGKVVSSANLLPTTNSKLATCAIPSAFIVGE